MTSSGASVLRALEEYQPFNDDEAFHRLETLELLRSQTSDVFSPTTHTPGHIVAGAVVTNEGHGKVLLALSSQGKWILPACHASGSPHLRAVVYQNFTGQVG